jgi:hypothetical protein
MKNKDLDFLEELAKSVKEGSARPKRIEVSARPPRRSSIIKSSGPGGVQFDFGMYTGNAIADNATMLLNRFADSTQSQIAASQRSEIVAAFDRFIEKGEQRFVPSGMIPAEWTKQIAGSTDDAIKAMHERGELNCSEDGSVNSVGPAFLNRHNATEINVGGELVKATSETDAAIIEMMKHQGFDDGDTEECFNEYS